MFRSLKSTSDMNNDYTVNNIPSNARPGLHSQPNPRDKSLKPLADVNLSRSHGNRRKSKDSAPWLSSILNDMGQVHTPRKLALPPISKSVSLGDLSKLNKDKSDNKKYKLRYTNAADDQEIEKLNETLHDIKRRLPQLHDLNIKAKLKEFWGWHEEHKRKATLSNNLATPAVPGTMAGPGPSERNRSMAALEQNVLLAKSTPTAMLDQNANDIHPTDNKVASSNTSSNTARRNSPAAKLPDPKLYRDHTMMTWQTWRDINQSDAYDNVQSYIDENELLPDDKKQVITNWIDSVECSTKPKIRPH